MKVKYCILAVLIFLQAVLAAGDLRARERGDRKPFWKYEEGSLFLFDSAGYETGIYRVKEAEITELDLNSDGNEELILTVKTAASLDTVYSIIVFDGAEIYTFVDSVYSGVVIPEIDFNAELNALVLSVGNTMLDSTFAIRGFPPAYEPRIFMVYDGEVLMDVSPEMYEIYIKVNDILMDEITGAYSANSYICRESEKMFGKLMTAVLNYLSAGETALALKYFDNYYNCPDKEIFRSKLRIK